MINEVFFLKYRLKGQRDFMSLFFAWISFPPAPEYSIRTVSNFFENSRRYSQVKVHHRYQRHRWQKYETALMVYSGAWAWGKLIHEKFRSRKSHDTVPLSVHTLMILWPVLHFSQITRITVPQGDIGNRCHNGIFHFLQAFALYRPGNHKLTKKFHRTLLYYLPMPRLDILEFSGETAGRQLIGREQSEPVLLTFMEPRNRFQGINSTSLCSLAGRYDNPFPTRFLAPVDCLKIPALTRPWQFWYMIHLMMENVLPYYPVYRLAKHLKYRSNSKCQPTVVVSWSVTCVNIGLSQKRVRSQPRAARSKSTARRNNRRFSQYIRFFSSLYWHCLTVPSRLLIFSTASRIPWLQKCAVSYSIWKTVCLFLLENGQRKRMNNLFYWLVSALKWQ